MANFNYKDHMNNIVNTILNSDSDIKNNIENKLSDTYFSANPAETDSDSDIINDVEYDDLKKIMKINYSYPDQTDPHFQKKIYKKREFYYHKIPPRHVLTEYQDIKKFRDMACGGNFRLRSQQSLLANFLNPDTPFRGLLIYHGVGTGKCLDPNSLISVYNHHCYIRETIPRELEH